MAEYMSSEFLMDIESDKDFALALQLQFQQDEEENVYKETKKCSTNSLVDTSWEQIDPTPDVHGLFLQFNAEYFWGKLDCVEVKWSKRMTLCAGLCSYERHSGMCSVRLSEPLLKLRPRKDLIQTLLHEMIHALLFVTHNNKDHDDHGPEFLKHMNRINKETGANVTVFHNFHDEVDFYRQHWWKCDGPCQKWHPYYGIVRRAMNRAPGPNDLWWAEHRQRCGGTYTKIKEPQDYKAPKKRKSTDPIEAGGKLLKTINNIQPFGGKGHVLGSSTVSNVSRLSTPGPSQRSPLKPSTSQTPPKMRQVDLTNFFGNSTEKRKILQNDTRKSNPKLSSKESKAKTFLRKLFPDLDDSDDCKIVEDKSGSKSSSNSATVDHDSPASSSRSENNDMCTCPVCNLSVGSSSINEHLDRCLLQQSDT